MYQPMQAAAITIGLSFMALGIKDSQVANMEMSVGAGYAQSLFDFSVAKGADAQDLASLSGYDPDLVTTPEARVAFSTFKQLMRTAKKLICDPAIALKFGAESLFQDISIVGLIAYSAPTMGEGFEQMNRFARLAVEVEGHQFQNRFSIVRRDGEVWLQDNRLNPNDFPELTESTFARFVATTTRHFGAVPFAKYIHVTHAAPDHLAEYATFLPVPITFGSTHNAICIHESWLDIKLNTSNLYAFGIFSERAEALLADLQRQSTMQAKVEANLMPLLHTGSLSIEKIAQSLGLSRASLYRRLADEGVTFAQIVDDLRHRLALHYLEANKVSVNECAYLVGFSDPASFSRAFKRWTGKSPSAARNLL
jgi:AraC-like DNA-binding protein